MRYHSANSERTNEPSRELAVGETATFDLRRMRDEQQPDRLGKTLPRDLDRGQFHWSISAAPNEPKIIGRAEVVSRSARISSSYSCPTCCPDSGPFGGFDPSAYTLAVDGHLYTNAHGDYYDCYSNYYQGSLSWTSMWTNNTSIATVNGGTGQLTGIGVGDTDVAGEYAYSYWSTDGMDCYRTYDTASDSAPVDVIPPSKLIRFNYTAYNPGAPDGYGPLLLTANTSNEVRNVKNEAIFTNRCGAYRNLVYELVDQNGDPITAAYSITENFSNYTHSTSYSSGTVPPSDTKNITANGIVTDTMFLGKTLPNCLGSDDNESFDQSFVVTINGIPYTLSTVNHVSRGRFSGTYKVDVTITTP